MGRALIQDSESDEGKIEDNTIENFQDKNNSSGKRSHSLTDAHRNNYNARTSTEGYHKDRVSQDSTSSDFDKEIFIKERDGQVISNNYDSERLHGKLRGSNEKIKYLFHALAQKYRNKFLQTVADGHHGGSPVSQQRHGSAYFKNKTFMDAYLVPECTEIPETVIDTRVFQKKDYSRQITKDVTSSLDKCGWHEPSEQENNDEASLLNEDNDTVEAELSTSDPFSEEVDLVSESSGSYSDEISIVQTSEGSVSGNEDTEDSSTDDDCESDVDENVEDGVFIVHNDEQQIPIPVFIDVIEDDTIHDQQLAPVDNEDAFIEESSCYDETSNELSGADQPDVVSQQNRLVVPPFYPFLEAATPTDYTTKHYILTNNGYYTEMAEDALVVVNNVQIPQIPDGANPVQPRLQDGADQESRPANHLRDNSTDQTDSIEQDEDMLVSNFSLLMSLEAPQVMEKSPIHLFSASSEGMQQISNFVTTESDDCEESSHTFDVVQNIDDQEEHLEII